MLDSLRTAATGLEAQSANMSQIANDLANVNTDGYKKSKTEFSDLMYKTQKEPGAQIGDNSISPTGIQTGTGVKVGASHKIFEQGPAKNTGNPLDIMVEGRGFFPVQRSNGEIAYSRAGAFHRDASGRMILSNGSVLQPPIVIPPNTLGVTIDSDGRVKAQFAGNQEQELGQIQLVSFVNEPGLKSIGENLFQSSLASGVPQQGIPGENGLGSLSQGMLEGSNVNPATSIIDMINTQKNFEMNTKVMGVGDKMLEALVNLK